MTMQFNWHRNRPDSPCLYEALNKFTGKAGKEKKRWTDKRIVDQNN